MTIKVLEKVEGFEEISNGQEEGDLGIQLVLNKDKAMKHGLTVAQILGELSSKLTTEKSAVNLTLDGNEYEVKIIDETNTLTKENLLNYTFETKSMDEDGKEFHVCLGSYTVNGKHSGYYARVSKLPRIDSNAADIPVLIERSKK